MSRPPSDDKDDKRSIFRGLFFFSLSYPIFMVDKSQLCKTKSVNGWSDAEKVVADVAEIDQVLRFDQSAGIPGQIMKRVALRPDDAPEGRDILFELKQRRQFFA